MNIIDTRIDNYILKEYNSRILKGNEAIYDAGNKLKKVFDILSKNLDNISGILSKDDIICNDTTLKVKCELNLSYYKKDNINFITSNNFKIQKENDEYDLSFLGTIISEYDKNIYKLRKYYPNKNIVSIHDICLGNLYRIFQLDNYHIDIIKISENIENDIKKFRIVFTLYRKIIPKASNIFRPFIKYRYKDKLIKMLNENEDKFIFNVKIDFWWDINVHNVLIQYYKTEDKCEFDRIINDIMNMTIELMNDISGKEYIGKDVKFNLEDNTLIFTAKRNY